MKPVTTSRKILVLIILLSPLALYFEACKKADTVTVSTPANNNSTNTLPILTTTTVSSIKATSAISGDNITNDGAWPMLSRGVG